MRINKILEVILLVFILGIAFLPRCIEVLNKNYVFGFDQGRDYLAVKSIVVDHKPTLIGSEIGAGAAGFQGIFHGPFHYYFLSIPFVLTDGDPYGGIILMFLFGISSVILSYFLGRKVFGPVGGMVTAFLVAISPILVSQSRFVWNSHPSTLFILITFYFVYLSYKKENKFIFLSSFFAGFIYNFELAIAIPLSMSLILFYIFVLKIKELKKYAVMLLGLVAAFFPMIFFEIRHDFMASKGLLAYVFSQKETTTSFLSILNTSVSHFDSFVYSFFDTFPRDIIPSWILPVIIFVPATYYFFKEKNQMMKKFIIFLILLIPVNFFVFSFLRNAVWTYYLIDLNIAYILIFAYSISSSFKKNNYWLKIFFLLFLIFVYIKIMPPLVKMFNYDYQDYGGDAKIEGKIDALDFIYKDAGGKEFGLLVFTPPIYTYAYDYLVWWYGQRKYNYHPYNEKKGLFYLLIQRDSSKPWSHIGWLETVIRDGIVVWEKELPSGFIVQKRLAE